MIDRELNIIRYSDGTMLPEEKRAFLAGADTDPKILEEIQTENVIGDLLRSDAEIIEQNVVFDVTPGAPLVETLAATAIHSKRKIVYFIIGTVAILAVLSLLLLLRGTSVPNSATFPDQKQIQRSIPETMDSLQREPQNTSPHTRIKTEAEKANTKVKTSQQTEKDIDLDQDLKGKPKVFTDPKAHMPIK